MTIRVAAVDDLPAVMAIERTPGFERYVGRSAEGEHRAMMASANFRYLVGEKSDGTLAAFAILRDLEDPHGNVYLKRVAVARPEEGLGFAFLHRVAGWVFARPAAHRFWLDCFAHNARAQRVYEKLGFTRDGVLRQAYRAPDGARVDLTMMALTRPDWENQAAGASQAERGRAARLSDAP
jgi:RimJ/RimL family protein N-acetyltransferase